MPSRGLTRLTMLLVPNVILFERSKLYLLFCNCKSNYKARSSFIY